MSVSIRAAFPAVVVLFLLSAPIHAEQANVTGAGFPVTTQVASDSVHRSLAGEGRESSEGSADGFISPAGVGPRVVRPFDKPAQNWLAGHRGVDLGLAPDRTVRAPAGGTVTFVGTVVDRGVLVVLHPNGLRSSFEPIISSLSRGERVGQGQLLGSVPAISEVPGHCSETCLHWGVRLGEEYIDPMVLLGRPTIVLFPRS